MPDAHITAALPESLVESQPCGPVLAILAPRVRRGARTTASTGRSRSVRQWPPRNPDSGRPFNSFTIGGIARNTGSHLCIFNGLLIRMPMRKTTKSPSICAAIRCAMTFGNTGLREPDAGILIRSAERSSQIRSLRSLERSVTPSTPFSSSNVSSRRSPAPWPCRGLSARWDRCRRPTD
jgi:hypothetical protein